MTGLGLGSLEEQPISWQAAHEALTRLARARAAADAEEGRWLLAAERAAVYVHLGYGSFSEYIERLFGYQPRSLQERLRVAEALEGLPAFARALSCGELSWSAVRELTRVAVRETEQEWLEFARGKTLRQLEQVLAHRQSGDTPASPPDLSARRHTLRFDVAAETLALFREAMSELRRRAGTQLDDDSALLELARCVLGGPSQEGRASYQIVLNVCPDCGNGRQQATGGLVPVGPDVVNMARCDAQHIGHIPGPSPAPANDLQPDQDQDENRHGRADTSGPATAPAPASGAHVSAPRSSGPVESPMAQVDASATQDGAHVSASARRSSSFRESPTAQVDASAVEQQAAAGRAPAKSSSPTRGSTGMAVVPRANPSTPPALRRAVVLRDQHRCQVPGCSNARWVDVHHIELRSEGGRHAPQNLVCVCGAHHRALHHGVLTLERSESGAIHVRHADGTQYGRNVHPQQLELQAKVFSALRHLGFREAQVRVALEQLRREPSAARASFDGLLRAALARLRAPGAQR